MMVASENAMPIERAAASRPSAVLDQLNRLEALLDQLDAAKTVLEEQLVPLADPNWGIMTAPKEAIDPDIPAISSLAMRLNHHNDVLTRIIRQFRELNERTDL